MMECAMRQNSWDAQLLMPATLKVVQRRMMILVGILNLDTIARAIVLWMTTSMGSVIQKRLLGAINVMHAILIRKQQKTTVLVSLIVIVR